MEQWGSGIGRMIEACEEDGIMHAIGEANGIGTSQVAKLVGIPPRSARAPLKRLVKLGPAQHLDPLFSEPAAPRMVRKQLHQGSSPRSRCQPERVCGDEGEAMASGTVLYWPM